MVLSLFFTFAILPNINGGETYTPAVVQNAQFNSANKHAVWLWDVSKGSALNLGGVRDCDQWANCDVYLHVTCTARAHYTSWAFRPPQAPSSACLPAVSWSSSSVHLACVCLNISPVWAVVCRFALDRVTAVVKWASIASQKTLSFQCLGYTKVCRRHFNKNYIHRTAKCRRTWITNDFYSLGSLIIFLALEVFFSWLLRY